MSSRYGLAQIGEWRSFGKIGLLFGAMLASVALLCAAAPSAFAKEQVGFYLAGEESEEEANQPRFEAETYPAHLEGESLSLHKFGFQVVNVECGAALAGGLTAPAQELILSTFYWPCKNSAGAFMSIFANGCQETVTVTNAGPPYVGEFGIECPGANPFQFVLSGGGFTCTISIPPQSGVDQVNFENTGSGSNRGVDFDFEVNGLEYSLESSPPIEGCSGTHNNGTYTGAITVNGFDEP